jgi:hypothetical protein
VLARGLWRLAQDKNARVNKKLVTVFNESGKAVDVDPILSTRCAGVRTLSELKREKAAADSHFTD